MIYSMRTILSVTEYHTPFIAEYTAMEHFFFENISQDIIPLSETATAYVTGIQFAFLNMLIQSGEILEPQNVMNASKDLFESKNLPWVWIVREHLLTSELTHVFINNGFDLREETTAMFYVLEKYRPPHLVTPLDIKDDPTLNLWIQPLERAFSVTQEFSRGYAQAHKRNNAPQFHHLIGMMDERPVTALTLSIQGSYARIDDAGTLPEHQRKGYATQMILHALGIARDLGATICFLEASKKAQSVYTKIGFKPLFENKIYGNVTCLIS